MVTSASLKETVWSWDATILMVDLFISSGMSSTPAKASSFYWSIYQGPPGLKASKASRLNSREMKSPSTWWKLQPIGVTLPSTSVLCVTQCLSLQGEPNKNLLSHCSLKHSGSQPDLVSERFLLWSKSPQAHLCMRFPRQEYFSGLPFPSPGDFPDPGIKPISPAWQAGSFPLSHLGSPGSMWGALTFWWFTFWAVLQHAPSPALVYSWRHLHAVHSSCCNFSDLWLLLFSHCLHLTQKEIQLAVSKKLMPNRTTVAIFTATSLVKPRSSLKCITLKPSLHIMT